MIEKVMKSMAEKDYEALASCFSEDCVFFDYCPSQNGKLNSYVYGSACMEMYFRRKFVMGEFEIGEPLIESEKTASFFGAYDGPYVYARLNIEEFNGDGLIKKAIVHPA